MTGEQVLQALQVHRETGLTGAEAERRRRQTGDNRLQEKKHTSIVVKFLEQWKDFMILTLIGAAVISTVVSFLNGDKDLTDPIIIFIIITVNAVLGVIQETKAEKSLDALKQLSAPSAMVLRDGKKQKIDACLVVPGDIVYLEAGSFVPADGRLLDTTDLKVEESALTGESVPVEKQATAKLFAGTPVAERINMALSTTVVTGGRGTMVVTETGMDTQVGHIAGMILADETKETPLQKRLAQTSKILGILALGICAVMFVVGLWKEQPLFEMFMTSVSLAVAAIPEGLPAIVTILLSQGVQRMARQSAVVRKLPAVETLGSATVICSDKTGTLTQNRMTVTEIASAQGQESLSGAFAKELLTCGALCNNTVFRREERRREVSGTVWRYGKRTGNKSTKYTLMGEPTEKALVEAAAQAGWYKDDLDLQYPRLSEIPFDSTTKQMTTTHTYGQECVRIVKGAPDVLVGQCKRIWQGGRRESMTASIKARILRKNDEMAGEGLRIIAVARTYGGTEELCFLGLIGMMDPPRPEVYEAVHTCRLAGIRPVMITGDHPATASAIARKLGILDALSRQNTDRRVRSKFPEQKEILPKYQGTQILTGTQLEAMPQEELIRTAPEISVYARVSPEHKVRIVKALQASHQVVAMTGDGVNDAPALKTADIGCAMGRGGTDVAKNSADMILTDDNFATIVAAVKEGRVIYDNIRKTIHFLLSSNIGEILTIFSAIVMGYASPLLPVQLLWMNLVTDSLPAVALGSEPADTDIMERPPIARNKGIFSDGLAVQMLLEGIVIGGLALIAYLVGGLWYDLDMARTMTFSVLSLSQLFHVFNIRSKDSLFQIGWFSNRSLNLAFLICFALQIGVVMIPAMANIFQVIPMDLKQWGIVMGLSTAPIPVMELQKWWNRRGG
ncbi:MAG: cation-translocating P-type ATPase [Lachnospiraceae bacterium]|nr:cation-translocating P-type ATPase [Lachnospiraceae bacterium]